MSKRSKCRQYLSNLAYLYLLIALLVPALVPAGYMIARDSTSNFVEVTICSAVNHRQVLLDVGTGRLLSESEAFQLAGVPLDTPDETSTTTSELCPFALASAVLITSAPLVDAVTDATLDIVGLTLPPALLINHPLPPLPARGPPILS